MGLPTITQSWTISANNRYTFVSVIGATGALMFSLSGFLISTMGYTCKGSCDGTTGAMDGVNRINAASKWATRFNGAAGAQSWIVVTDGAGVDWCFSFNSASDDIVRLAHSTGGQYVAAATPTQQPTATDECFDAASGTWVNATASLDRVWHMWGSSDKKMWRCAVYRNGVLAQFLAGEKFTSALITPASFTLATGGGTVGAIKSTYNGVGVTTGFNALYAASGSTTEAADLCRVRAGGADINAKATQGGESPGGSTPAAGGAAWAAEKPALQGGTGETLFPLTMASVLAGADGKLGNKIDAWFALTNSNTVPAVGETFGALQLYVVLAGALILPWDNNTQPVTI